jgi:hypothetical protein
LLLAFICVSQAAVTIQFSKNITVTDSVKTEFAYRKTQVWSFSLPNIVTAAVYASAGLSGVTSTSTNQFNGQFVGDLIVGAIRFVVGKVPATFFGYIGASASVAVTNTGGDITSSFNYSAAGAFLALSYLRIEERSGGSEVRTCYLKNLGWAVSNVTSQNGLHFVTLTASEGIFDFPPRTDLYAGEKLSMTFIVSEVMGEVQIGAVSAKVTPKKLESIIEIQDWQYKSQGNHLVLISGVGTGAAAGAISASGAVSSGSGATQTYAYFSSDVDVGGTKKKAYVTKSAVASTQAQIVIDDTSVTASLNAAYKGAASFHIVEVAFPAGANHIIYDPGAGAGSFVDGAASFVVFFLLLAICVLLF